MVPLLGSRMKVSCKICLRNGRPSKILFINTGVQGFDPLAPAGSPESSRLSWTGVLEQPCKSDEDCEDNCADFDFCFCSGID